MTIELIINNEKESVKMSKQPLSTLLLEEKNKTAALETSIGELNAKIADLEKKLKDKENTSNTWYKEAQGLKEQIEQLDQFLDAVPSPVARESQGENQWDKVKRTPMTRLAAWMANLAASR